MTIKVVEMKKPDKLPSMSAIRMEIAEFIIATMNKTITRIW